jgi:hypothetical protein
MSAYRDSNEQLSENKNTTTLSKEPDAFGTSNLQESSIDEETNIRVGVRGVLEPDTSSELDLQESSVEETETWVDVRSVLPYLTRVAKTTWNPLVPTSRP